MQTKSKDDAVRNTRVPIGTTLWCAAHDGVPSEMVVSGAPIWYGGKSYGLRVTDPNGRPQELALTNEAGMTTKDRPMFFRSRAGAVAELLFRRRAELSRHQKRVDDTQKKIDALEAMLDK